jgi:hypothetical protein
MNNEITIKLIKDTKGEFVFGVNAGILPIKNITNCKLEYKNGQVTFELYKLQENSYGEGIKGKEEKVNMLEYLVNDKFYNYNIVENFRKSIDFALQNIYLTSMYNARKLIKEKKDGNK